MSQIKYLFHQISGHFSYRYSSAILMIVVFISSGAVELVDHLDLSKDQTHNCNCRRMLPRLCQKNGICPFKSGSSSCCNQKPIPNDDKISLSSKCSCDFDGVPGLASFNSYKFVQFDNFQITCVDPNSVELEVTVYERNILNYIRNPEHPPPETIDLS